MVETESRFKLSVRKQS